jgi:serine/threonine protein kinase/tetratricopeptide (TPR) repeat protein
MSELDFSVKRHLDVICDEFERHWSDNARSDIKPLLERIDQKHRDQLLRMLVDVDVELRSKAGKRVLADEYSELGEQVVAQVGELLAVDPDVPIPPTSSTEPSLTRTAAKPPPQSAALNSIGPYKLLQQIGEGGMGTVWMAEQEKPVRRRVALKLIRGDIGSKDAIARFEAERQALAMMDHQNIAKVLDAGTTDGGNPYFVMELIKGIPITEYCDQHKLSILERLSLFVPVCKAVQHAHLKGVIHRDLKPSNVLVTLYDGRPVAKIIDFGLAKALDHANKLTDKTMFTEFGKVVGTLQYMAPEQAEMNALDVDTRADVYSLGVMLYELLTGSTPLDKETVGKIALLQVLAIIREKEPPKPSARLSSSGDAITGISGQRKIAPAKLQDILRGDLDWVVMKALDKDRTRRYETASGLADDLERFVHDEPVLAGRPSVRYQLTKFARRNRAAVLSAILIAFALLLGIAGTTFGLISAKNALHEAVAARHAEAQRAENERLAKEQAQKRLTQIEASSEILGSIFDSLDPSQIDRSDQPLRLILVENLDNAVKQLEGEAIGDALVVANLQKRLGVSLLGLDESDKAIQLLEKANATFQTGLGPAQVETIACMNVLAIAYQDAGRLDQAMRLYEQALELAKSNLEANHLVTLKLMNNLATLYSEVDKDTQALQLFDESLKIRKAEFGTSDPDTLKTMNNLARTYVSMDKLDLALQLFDETLRLQKARLSANHPDLLSCMHNLGSAYAQTGEYELAIPLLKETLDGRTSKLGPSHTDTLTTMCNLAAAYLSSGKTDLATPLIQHLKEAKFRPRNQIFNIGNMPIPDYDYKSIPLPGPPDEIPPINE